MNNKISCVIPAYNEEKGISQVLKVLLDVPKIDEIIVVDDGSDDNTREIVKNIIEKNKQIRLISYSKNRGKSYAVMKGILKSNNDVIMLIDADIKNLKVRNIKELLGPILNLEADITISLIRCSIGGYPIYNLLGYSYLFSGARAFRKDLFNDYSYWGSIKSYGLEVFINRQIIENSFRIKIIDWKDIINPTKSNKFGLIKGLCFEIKMIFNILHTVRLRDLISQSIKMRALLIKN